MTSTRLRTTVTLLCLFSASAAQAQSPQPTAAVPKLVRFSGSFRPANGQPAQPVEGVTLAVYRDQTGGEALWSEVQNVSVDADGHYSVLMGATQNAGMPLDLFSSGEPRWLGAQFNRPGEAEQPRVLLASVPYALKASDAETLGGRPASAYLLAAPTVGVGANAAGTAASPTAAAAPAASIRAVPPVNSGFPNFIAMFTNSTDVGDSVMYQANGAIGIGTTAPGISLDVRTGSLPQLGVAGTTDYLTFFASDQYGPAIYWDPAKDMRFGRGGTGLYNPYGFVEQMRIQSSTGNVGIGTSAPASKLDVAGDINFTDVVRYQGSPILRVPGSVTSGSQAGVQISNNLAVGIGVLQNNSTGSQNTATGYQTLQLNTGGHQNTASGYIALINNTTGSFNSVSGAFALRNNIDGSFNTAIGQGALGFNTGGNNNTAIGYNAGTLPASGNGFNIHIGSAGAVADNATIRIGDPTQQSSFFAAGIVGVTTGNNDAIPVMIDSAGQLGTVSSSRRFKEDVEDMGAASYDLMRLRPVTYRYKKAFADGSKPIQYGLIAEEVAEVYPNLVAHSADGQIQTVKYQVLDSMLLNEVQRQQTEIGRLAQQNQSLQERLARLEAALASSVEQR